MCCGCVHAQESHLRAFLMVLRASLMALRASNLKKRPDPERSGDLHEIWSQRFIYTK